MARVLFVGLVAIAFFYTASPLVFPVIMGGILAVLFMPWVRFFERKKLPSSMGSAVVTLGVTLTLLLPISTLIFYFAKTGYLQLQMWKKGAATLGPILNSAPVPASGSVNSLSWMESILSHPSIQSLLSSSGSSGPSGSQGSPLDEVLPQLVGSVWGKVMEVLGAAISQLPTLAVGLGVTVVSLFFFMVDGPRLVAFFRRNSIFSELQTEHLIGTVAGMCRSVVLASLVSGVAQAGLEMLACLITGTAHLFFIGLLVFLASFIPLVGSLPITLAIAFQRWTEGSQTEGMLLFVTAILIVLLDNLIRPLFLRGAGQLHPLLAFLTALGGLQTLGFIGVFLGPIIAALFVMTLRILDLDSMKGLREPLPAGKSGVLDNES